MIPAAYFDRIIDSYETPVVGEVRVYCFCAIRVV
jgi:hypothetical protein